MHIAIILISFQVPAMYALRVANLTLDFPDQSDCKPESTPPGSILVQIETGNTALDVLVAAADNNSYYNFKTSYYGNAGFAIDAINGTASQNPCYWFFYYQIPGLPLQMSQLGVSNVVVPGNRFAVVMRYMKSP